MKQAIDAGADHRNVMSNNELMRLVAELDSSNAWAVGRFDALAREARLPSDVQAQLPGRDVLLGRRPCQWRRQRRVSRPKPGRSRRPESPRRRPRLPGDGPAAVGQPARHAADGRFAPAVGRWQDRRAFLRHSRASSSTPSRRSPSRSRRNRRARQGRRATRECTKVAFAFCLLPFAFKLPVLQVRLCPITSSSTAP